MGTKDQPGMFDCHAVALPDEPTFTLLARDPSAPLLVQIWAALRAQAIEQGQRPVSETEQTEEAMRVAVRMATWRQINPPKRWRGEG